MDIDKTLLQESFKNGNYEYFFSQAKKITDFVLIRSFGIYDEEIRSDINQECLENLWKKILAKKVDPSKDLMSFIWANSSFRVREINRKENRRNRIAPMLSYDDEDAEWMKVFSGYMYNPEIQFFLNEAKAEFEKLQEEQEKNKKPKKTRNKLVEMV